jgi:hypothetical protein
MKFDFLAAFLNDVQQDDPRVPYFHDDHFNYRIINDEVQVGVKLNFDRWANSIDYVFSIPKTVKSYRGIREQLAKIALDIKDAGEWGREARITSRGVYPPHEWSSEKPTDERATVRKHGGVKRP